MGARYRNADYGHDATVIERRKKIGYVVPTTRRVLGVDYYVVQSESRHGCRPPGVLAHAKHGAVNNAA